MSKLSREVCGVLATAGVLIGALLLGGCQKGPGQVPSLVRKVIVVESGTFSAGRHELEADYVMPEITAEVAEQGTVEAFIDLGPDEGEWTALPYAYQYPEKWAALVTYRYQEGAFTLLIVSPNPDLRRAIAERIDGYRVKVIITTP